MPNTQVQPHNSAFNCILIIHKLAFYVRFAYILYNVDLVLTPRPLEQSQTDGSVHVLTFVSSIPLSTDLMGNIYIINKRFGK